MYFCRKFLAVWDEDGRQVVFLLRHWMSYFRCTAQPVVVAKIKSQKIKYGVFAAMVGLLAACGGGGGSVSGMPSSSGISMDAAAAPLTSATVNNVAPAAAPTVTRSISEWVTCGGG